jgi:hypothetical protein
VVSVFVINVFICIRRRFNSKFLQFNFNFFDNRVQYFSKVLANFKKKIMLKSPMYYDIIIYEGFSS